MKLNEAPPCRRYHVRGGECLASIRPTRAGLVGGVVLWKRLVNPRLPASGFASDPAMDDLASLQTGLIICMALAEGLGLFGVLKYFLGGPLWIAIASVPASWGTLLVVWPRRGWYGLR